MLEDRATFERWQSNGVKGYIYESALGIDDARLMVLYTYMGETQKAIKRFEQATNGFAQLALKEGRTPSTITFDELFSKIERAETNLPLRWKKVRDEKK